MNFFKKKIPNSVNSHKMFKTIKICKRMKMKYKI